MHLVGAVMKIVDLTFLKPTSLPDILLHCKFVDESNIHRMQWLRGRVLDSRLREPGFESCATMLKPWASLFTLHCSSSLSCIHEYLDIDIGGYMYEQPSRINCNIWLGASQRS